MIKVVVVVQSYVVVVPVQYGAESGRQGGMGGERIPNLIS
jgi:hypothetical protein